MPYFNNNLFKTNADIIYVNDLELLNNNLASIDPGTLVLYSYDYNTVKGFKEVRGSSYELFFVSEDGTLKQLSYNIFPGNGLSIDNHGLMSIGIDNNTIIKNSKNELMYDYKKFKTSYGGYIKGLLKGDNLPYHDSLINNFNEHGYIASDNGIIYMNNGLSMALYDIEDYIEKINKMFSDIEAILITLQTFNEVFYVGDILYKTRDGIITSFKGRDNEPYMICVIASGVEPDGYARFMPLKYKLNDSLYALQEDYFTVKNTYSQIPIYNISEYNRSIIANGEPSTISVTYGYIATDQSKWLSRFDNPLVNKHYYFGQSEGQTISSAHKWYIDPQLMHQGALYSLGGGAMTSEKITDINIVGDMTVNVSVSINFSDGFVGKYSSVQFKYDSTNRKFVNTSTVEADLNSVISSNIINSNTQSNYSQYTPNIYLQENEMQNLVDQNYINSIDVNQYMRDNETLFGARNIEIVSAENMLSSNNEILYGCGGGGSSSGSTSGNSASSSTGNVNYCSNLYTCVAQSSSSSTSNNTSSNTCTNYEYDCPSGVNCSFFGVPHIDLCDSITANLVICDADCSSHCAQYTAPVALKNYIFKLIMPAGLIDMDYGYLEFMHVYSNNQIDLSSIIYTDGQNFQHYNNSTGNTYIFTAWVNNIINDGIKIKWHASKNWKTWTYDKGIDQFSFMFNATTMKTELISDNKYYKIIDLNNNFEFNKIQFNPITNMRPTKAVITNQTSQTVKFNSDGIISISATIVKYTYGMNCAGFQNNGIRPGSIYINTNDNSAFMTGVQYFPNVIIYFNDGAYVNINNVAFTLTSRKQIVNSVEITLNNIINTNTGYSYNSNTVSRIVITGIRRQNENQYFISSTFMDNVGKLDNI